jgi:hypothetical protein
VQTFIALLCGYETIGTTVNSVGTEAVWFDMVEVWESDHDYSGWRLRDNAMKHIVLGAGAQYSKFYYVPPSDGGFCVGKLTTSNIQTCALGIWSMPDVALSADQKILSEEELLPKTSIFGYGPSAKQQDIGRVYDLVGYAGNDYDDSIEAMTRRCLFQWGHPVGYYATGSLSQTGMFGGTTIKIKPRNLKGGTGTDTVNADTAFYITTNGAAAGSSIVITFSSNADSYPGAGQAYTFTSDVTNALLSTTDSDTGNPLSIYAVGDFVSVIIDFNGASSQEVTIKTVSIWECSEF